MAQKTISAVKDADTGLPLEGITIRQNNTPALRTSDNKGYYALETDVYGEAITLSNPFSAWTARRCLWNATKALDMSANILTKD